MKTKQILCVCLCFLLIFSDCAYILGAEKTRNRKTEEQFVTKETGEQEVDVSDCDKRLADMGTPEEVIDNLDDNFKHYIVENSETSETYEGFGEDVLQNESLQASNLINARSSMLSDSDIYVKVYATGVKLNGKKYVKIYPAFEWKKSCSIDNDTFAFSLYDDWECKGGNEVGLTVNSVNKNGVLVEQTDEPLKPTDATSKGYGFHISSKNIKPLPKEGHYEGYAYFYAKKKKDKASNSISLNYIHDTATFFSTSYGISIGTGNVTVDISASSNQNKLQLYSKNLGFSFYFSSK